MKTKTCRNPECQQKNPQSTEEFYKQPSGKDGLNARCKRCVREKQLAKYRSENPRLEKPIPPDGWKYCSNAACEQTNPQPIEDFFRQKTREDGRASNCKKCATKSVYRWNDKNKDRKRTNQRIWKENNPDFYYAFNVEARHNITWAQYLWLLDQQNGGCRICGKVADEGKRLDIDHDHTCCPNKADSCGKCIRGILCRSHNIKMRIIDEAGGIWPGYGEWIVFPDLPPIDPKSLTRNV